jgi:hypothetical protein
MALSASKTWTAGEILTASDLNNEFLNVYQGGQTLGWPATVTKNFAGHTLVLDVDGDTSMTAGTADDRVDFTVGGVLLFQLDGTTASSVNGLALIGDISGTDPQIEAFGADDNVGINLVTKGTGVAQVNGVTIYGVGFEVSDQAILPQQIFG